ncbi:hypothetical protein LDENG_00259480 [Lucifuga dentata]|nr:hypothetical protein LDENG_00259480 [Lucifuga dentata]
MASNASHMLEAALEQMDDIIAGSKTAEGVFGALMGLTEEVCNSHEFTQQLTLDPALKTLQLTEALRVVLDGQGSVKE